MLVSCFFFLVGCLLFQQKYGINRLTKFWITCYILKLEFLPDFCRDTFTFFFYLHGLNVVCVGFTFRHCCTMIKIKMKY